MGDEKGTRQSIYIKHQKCISDVSLEEGKKFNGAMIESMFWDTYLGRDKSMQGILLGMYDEEYDIKSALIKLLIYFTSNQKFGLPEFVSLIKIARVICGNSEWTDNDLSSRKRALSCLPGIFEKEQKELARRYYHSYDILDKNEIEEMKERLSSEDEEDYDEDRWKDEEMVEVVDLQDNIKKIIESENTTPGDVLDFMISVWEGCYQKYSEAHLAVAYCLEHSSDTVDNPHLRQRLRRFCIYLSETLYGIECRNKLREV